MDGAWLFAERRTGGRTTGRLEGFHGTSLHMLERAMAAGMETGWNGLERKGKLHLGVYFHVEVRAHLCHNYMLYSGLDSTGFLVAPVVCLSAPRSDPYGRKVVIRSSGWLSNLTYPDVCRIHGVWFHVVHTLQFWEGDRSCWLYAEPRFCRELEPEPGESRDALEARSYAIATRRWAMQATP